MSVETGYAFLDCGGGRRLERLGDHVVVRPAPAAVWPPGLPASVWAGAEMEFSRSAGWRGQAPVPWRVRLGVAEMGLRQAGAGQIGIFPEHIFVCEALTRLMDARAGRSLRVLHLFAHTGLVSLHVAARDDVAEVTHVDGAAGAVRQARENAALSGLGEKRIRWLVDDATGFAEREVRRGREYDLIVADPPAFGRGGKRGGGEWKLERDLPKLTRLMGDLLAARSGVLCISCHSEGWGAEAIGRIVSGEAGMEVFESVSLVLRAQKGGRDLPCGQALFARHDGK